MLLGVRDRDSEIMAESTLDRSRHDLRRPVHSVGM